MPKTIETASQNFTVGQKVSFTTAGRGANGEAHTGVVVDDVAKDGDRGAWISIKDDADGVTRRTRPAQVQPAA